VLQDKATRQVQGLAAFRLCPRHRQGGQQKGPRPRTAAPAAAARRPCQAFTTHSPSSSLNSSSSSSSLLLLINTGGEVREEKNTGKQPPKAAAAAGTPRSHAASAFPFPCSRPRSSTPARRRHPRRPLLLPLQGRLEEMQIGGGQCSSCARTLVFFFSFGLGDKASIFWTHRVHCSCDFGWNRARISSDGCSFP
jgi:hypothetical protein